MKKILIVGIVSLIFPSLALASIDSNLKYGATGGEVNELQDFLIGKGFLSVSSPTNNFFSLTLKAVIAYQGSVGLPTTGFVGPLTRTKINAELANQLSQSDAQEVVETGTTSAPVVQCPTGFTCTKSEDQTKAIQGLQNEVTALRSQVQQQTSLQQQIVVNTTPQNTSNTPASSAGTQTSIPTPVPECVVNNEPSKCLIVTPESVQGGTTATITIKTPAYQFKMPNGACVSQDNVDTCVGSNNIQGRSISISPDGKVITYTMYVPDNHSDIVQVFVNGIYNNNAQIKPGGVSSLSAIVKVINSSQDIKDLGLDFTPRINKYTTTNEQGDTKTFYTAEFQPYFTTTSSGNIDIGLPNSSFQFVSPSSVVIYKNGAVASQSDYGQLEISYSQWAQSVLSRDGTYFTIARNQGQTRIPVNVSFKIDGTPSDTYSVELKSITVRSANGGISTVPIFMNPLSSPLLSAKTNGI